MKIRHIKAFRDWRKVIGSALVDAGMAIMISGKQREANRRALEQQAKLGRKPATMSRTFAI